MIALLKIIILSAAVAITSKAAERDTNAPAARTERATNSPASGADFNSFKIIAERNIFNQSRGPRSRRNEIVQRTPVVQSLGLVGTMSYKKGDFAFFDGSQPEFKKPVKVGEKIGEYEVKAITPSTVKVANEKQEFELKVGQSLRKEDEGEWQLRTGPPQRGPSSSSGSASTASATTAPDDAASSSSGGSSEEEALRRLMEKRAKEMEQ